jgi:hypothetical protein
MLLTVAVLGITLAWAAIQWKWMRDRAQARAWLGASQHSWYAPSMGGKHNVNAPLSVRILGETGIVGIGLDVNEYAGRVPYSPEELKRLFPESRVDFSRDGNWVDNFEWTDAKAK